MIRLSACLVCAFILFGCSEDKALDKVESSIEALKDDTQKIIDNTQEVIEDSKQSVNEAKLESKQNQRSIKEAIATQTLEA